MIRPNPEWSGIYGAGFEGCDWASGEGAPTQDLCIATNDPEDTSTQAYWTSNVGDDWLQTFAARDADPVLGEYEDQTLFYSDNLVATIGTACQYPPNVPW